MRSSQVFFTFDAGLTYIYGTPLSKYRWKALD